MHIKFWKKFSTLVKGRLGNDMYHMCKKNCGQWTPAFRSIFYPKILEKFQKKIEFYEILNYLNYRKTLSFQNLSKNTHMRGEGVYEQIRKKR